MTRAGPGPLCHAGMELICQGMTSTQGQACDVLTSADITSNSELFLAVPFSSDTLG